VELLRRDDLPSFEEAAGRLRAKEGFQILFSRSGYEAKHAAVEKQYASSRIAKGRRLELLCQRSIQYIGGFCYVPQCRNHSSSESSCQSQKLLSRRPA
jgi:hypothetical protein